MKQTAPEIETPELEGLTVKSTLRFGMRDTATNKDVETLQQRLKDKGYDILPDGIFLRLTKDVVKKFQEDHGLLVDGVAGAITLGAMGILVERPVTVTPPDISKLTKGTPEWYEANFKILTYDPGYETKINNAAKRAIAGQERFRNVVALAGIKPVGPVGIEPWKVIAGLQNMEASGSFAGVLHNGEKILGTGKKTSLVPKGRGPFKTWEDSALDAIFLKGLNAVTDWSVGNVLRIVERYNGTGYLTGAGKAENSPYLWSMSSINDGRGKYVSDGKFDSNAYANGQVGFATLIKEIDRLTTPTVVEPKPPVSIDPLARLIIDLNPNLEPRMVTNTVFHFKTQATVTNKDFFFMVNYSLNEAVSRFYLIEVASGKCILTAKCAHGSKSDPNKDGWLDEFSNIIGSNKTSVGAMITGIKFHNPKWKHVWLLYGLEKGLNDNVRKREILLHTTLYVNDTEGKLIGDTLGCIGVSEKTGDAILSYVKPGTLIYSWVDKLPVSGVA